jgi:hypothetical protein
VTVSPLPCAEPTAVQPAARRPRTTAFPRWGLIAALACACSAGSKDDDDDDDDDDIGNSAHLLVVLDNSPSMAEEAGALGLAVDAFLSAATASGIEWTIGVTTTTVDYNGGDEQTVEPGEAGSFVGTGAPISSSSETASAELRRALLCEATYWDPALIPSDPSYSCNPDDPTQPAAMTEEYLDCLCGFGEWEDNAAGSGDEEPIEAALMALCRAVPTPPEACNDSISPFSSTSDITNDGWYQDGDPFHVLVVSDEGDNSRQLAQGETDPGVYLDAFAQFAEPLHFSSIALALDPDSGSAVCSDTSVPTWTLDRLVAMATATGGFTFPLAVEGEDGSCAIADMSPALTTIGSGSTIDTSPDTGG